MTFQQAGEKPLDRVLQNLVRIGDFRIEVALHRHGPLAVHPLDARDAAPLFQIRHFPQRVQPAFAVGDVELFEVRQAVLIRIGELHVDLIGFRTHLDFVRRAAEVSRAQLPRDRRGVEPAGQRAGFQADADLGLAGAQVVLQIEHPFVAPQPAEQIERRLFQLPQVLPLQADIDGQATRPDDGFLVRDVDHAGDRSHGIAPPCGDRVEVHRPDFRLEQVDKDRRHMRPRFIRVPVLPVLHHDVLHQRLAARLLRREAGVDLFDRAHHPRHDAFHLGQGRALRREYPRLQHIAVDFREADHLEPPPGNHADRDHEGRQEQPEEQVTPVNRKVDRPPQDMVTDVLEPAFKRRAKPVALLGIEMLERMRQVIGQNKKRLHQADRERHQKHHRQHPEDLSHFPFQQQRDAAEHHHRGHIGREHSQRHLRRAVDRGVQCVFSPRQLGHDIFRNDDGVVHQQPQSQEQRHHGQHVDRQAQRLHDEKRRHEGNGESHRHPERQAEIEEQPQHGEHQDQSLQGVAAEHGEPVLDDFGPVLREREVDARRGGLPLLHEKIAHHRHDIERVFRFQFLNLDQSGAFTVEQDFLLLVFEHVTDGGDLAEPHLLAGRGRDHAQVFVPVQASAFVLIADHDVGVRRFEDARRQVHVLPRHGIGDVGDAQAVLHQRRRRNLNADLVLGEPENLHQRNVRQQQQAILDLLAVQFQVGHGHRAGNGDGDHRIGAAQFADDGHLGLGGKIVDGFNFGLDLVEESADVAPVAHLHFNAAHVLARLAFDLDHVVDVAYRLFDALADSLFDLFRRGAGIHHGNLYLGRGEIRKSFAAQVADADEAEEQGDQHQQVGGGGVAGEIAQEFKMRRHGIRTPNAPRRSGIFQKTRPLPESAACCR